MFRQASLAVLASLLALGGCTTFSRGAVSYLRTDEGRPIVDPGPAESYLLWHDPAGWHLRVRSDTTHTFRGLVITEGTRSVTAIGIGADAVRAADTGIGFEIVADGRTGEAGIDWQGGCAEFSLYVDGDTRPLRVFAGAFGANPTRIPFSLCPNWVTPPPTWSGPA
jgi:hypothetical protein